MRRRTKTLSMADGDAMLLQAERVAAAEPAPAAVVHPIEAAESVVTGSSSQAKRDRRQQRRKSRPHGRAR
jgi:hypothetical protein